MGYNSLGTLTHTHFKSEIGTDFTAETVLVKEDGDITPRPLKIKLLRMIEGRPTLKDFRLPCTLIFATPRDTLLVEGHYALKSESGHRYEISMSPINSPVGENQLYQAIFN